MCLSVCMCVRVLECLLCEREKADTVIEMSYCDFG